MHPHKAERNAQQQAEARLFPRLCAHWRNLNPQSHYDRSRRRAGAPALAEYPVKLSRLRTVTGGVALPCVRAGQKTGRPARVQNGGRVRGGVSHSAGVDDPERDGVLRERGESLFARRLFRILRDRVLRCHHLPDDLHAHYGGRVPEPQPRAGRKHLRGARIVRCAFMGHAAGIRDGQRHV